MSRIDFADGLPDGNEKPGEALWLASLALCAACAGLVVYSRN